MKDYLVKFAGSERKTGGDGPLPAVSVIAPGLLSLSVSKSISRKSARMASAAKSLRGISAEMKGTSAVHGARSSTLTRMSEYGRANISKVPPGKQSQAKSLLRDLPGYARSEASKAKTLKLHSEAYRMGAKKILSTGKGLRSASKFYRGAGIAGVGIGAGMVAHNLLSIRNDKRKAGKKS